LGTIRALPKGSIKVWLVAMACLSNVAVSGRWRCNFIGRNIALGERYWDFISIALDVVMPGAIGIVLILIGLSIATQIVEKRKQQPSTNVDKGHTSLGKDLSKE
jgi:hypothetical protein